MQIQIPILNKEFPAFQYWYSHAYQPKYERMQAHALTEMSEISTDAFDWTIIPKCLLDYRLASGFWHPTVNTGMFLFLKFCISFDVC